MNLRVRLSEFLAQCKHLPPDGGNGRARLYVREAAPQGRDARRPGLPTIHLLDFIWDGEAWQTEGDLTITFV